jgi:hypothetical protein
VALGTIVAVSTVAVAISSVATGCAVNATVGIDDACVTGADVGELAGTKAVAVGLMTGLHAPSSKISEQTIQNIFIILMKFLKPSRNGGVANFFRSA